ncbi:zinc finger CCCH domain-containing protein 24-like [Phalaenopsis equestris]|uniref:zinc finger CCCH domain-containing protein 24-like n=1 Tax=Phalaenopsis equestris TaxID=78828 RepID=UPI0009E62CB0|nr:zinc finger CCCH domain-containing protein 24-like [Phalaenopsis equestris]
MNGLNVEIDDTFASVLELAANNDVDGFKEYIDRNPSAVDAVGDWYGRKKVIERRTPLMVAATYGSLDVLNLILKLSSADINRYCGPDKTTALHCAASGGSLNVVKAVKILLSAGADPNGVDANGDRPVDVISVPRKLSNVKAALEDLLGSSGGAVSEIHHQSLRVSTSASNSLSLSSSTEEDGSPSSDSTSSPMTGKFQELPSMPEKKEYPIDPSLPDIKNCAYTTDEFRMFSFKVRPCSRAYSHDWTECPFVHPGENARRRDPRKYHYSCVPCPDFRKGACRRGDMCEYAHGVFECWLHPAQYRTRLCKDGTNCARRVCFFAHTNEELRPLYISTGSAVPSPRSSVSSAMGLMPGSPSSVSAIMSSFTPPMSPSANTISHNSLNWQQPNVPALHLPGSNLQSSRLRSSLNARDIQLDDYLMQDYETQQLINDLFISRIGSSAGNRIARSKNLNGSNLDDLFSAELSLSPRYNNSEQGAMFSPSHKAAILNQFQQQQQSLLSPIKTGMFSPKTTMDQPIPGHSSLLQASLGLSSPGRMSPRSLDAASPLSSRLTAFAQREKQQQQSLRSHSSRELGAAAAAVVGSPVSSSWSRLGSSSRTIDWGVNGEDLGQLRRSSSFELRSSGEEPDVSWVHSLVKESPPEKPLATSAGHDSLASRSSNPNDDSSGQIDSHDHAAVLGAWLEQMQLDQLVA